MNGSIKIKSKFTIFIKIIFAQNLYFYLGKHKAPTTQMNRAEMEAHAAKAVQQAKEEADIRQR